MEVQIQITKNGTLLWRTDVETLHELQSTSVDTYLYACQKK